MSPDKENPCKYGLTPECFEEYPEFAKKAFAIRLLCLLVNCDITSSLPGKLGKLLSIPTWGLGYPWPDAPFWWDTITIPEYALLTGPDSPLFLSPWHPGRHSPVASAATAGRKYLWWDYFHSLDTDEWDVTIVSEGLADIVNDKLRILKLEDYGLITVDRTDPYTVLTNFHVSFDLTFVSGSATLFIYYTTGTKMLSIAFKLPDIVKIYDGYTYHYLSVSDFTNIEHNWNFSYRGGYLKVYQDTVLKLENVTLAAYGSYPGRFQFKLTDAADLRIDNYYIGLL